MKNGALRKMPSKHPYEEGLIAGFGENKGRLYKLRS